LITALGIYLRQESGKDAVANALLKAQSYAGFTKYKVPVISIDYSLRIEGLPEELQPGVNVRRVNGPHLDDDALLEHYVKLIDSLGGSATGTWTTGIAFILSESREYTHSIVDDTLFVSTPSPNKTKGEPLNRIQIHPILKKYKSDLTFEEKAVQGTKHNQEFFKFIESKIKYL